MTTTLETSPISSKVYWAACSKYDDEKRALAKNKAYHECSKESADMINTVDGGRKSEYIMAEQVSSWGYKVKVGTGKEKADFDVYINGEAVKVECKKGELQRAKPTQAGQYTLQAINNESIATIAMFVTPEAILCRIANTDVLCDWASRHFTWLWENKKPGYTINFNGRTYKNKNEQGGWMWPGGDQVFYPFTEENLLRCIKQ